MESKHCALDELKDNDFHSFTHDEKCKLKNKNSTSHLSLEYKDGKFTRTFQSSWYTKFTWLCSCDKRNKLFLFYLCIFRAEKKWSFDEILTIKI